MRWCLDQYTRTAVTGQEERGTRLIDGVITDDPALFREVCETWEDEQDGQRTVTMTREGVEKMEKKNTGKGGDGGFGVVLKLLWSIMLFRILGPLFYSHRRATGKLDFLDDIPERNGETVKVKPS
jgi:hypothetical protein